VRGEVVTSVQAVEAKLEELKAEVLSEDEPHLPLHVDVTLLRRGQEIRITTEVPLLVSDGARRVVCWHGLVLHEIPRALRELGPVPDGVSISQTMLGTPSDARGIDGNFLVAVDGSPTPSLDAVIALRRTKHDVDLAECGRRRYLRIETSDTSGRRFMRTLEPDLLFCPVTELKQDEHGVWSCTEHVDAT